MVMVDVELFTLVVVCVSEDCEGGKVKKKNMSLVTKVCVEVSAMLRPVEIETPFRVPVMAIDVDVVTEMIVPKVLPPSSETL
jgi:hypothetical protein